ncbi:hypothetical protein CHUAL_005939 [Chamberlinius hualienensis]
MAGDERLEKEGELSVVSPYTLSRKNVKDNTEKFGISLSDIKSEKVSKQCVKVNGCDGNGNVNVKSNNSSHHHSTTHIPHLLLPPSLPNNNNTTTPVNLNTQSLVKNTTFNSDVVVVVEVGLGIERCEEEEAEADDVNENSRSLAMAKCASRGVDPDSMDLLLHHPLSRTNKLSRLNLQQTMDVLDTKRISVSVNGEVDEDEDEENIMMDSDFDDEERPLSSLMMMESNDNKEEKCAAVGVTTTSATTITTSVAVAPGNRMRKNKRRTLRFHSSESSDSGVAALSSTDSSQSSGTSDITEPCSPPSPVSPPSSTSSSDIVSLHHHHHHHHHHHLHHDGDDDHDDGFEVTNSPPSCLGSYDSGVEETTPSSQSPDPQTPSSDQKDDHNLLEEHQVLEEEFDLFTTGEEVVCVDSGKTKCQSFSDDCVSEKTTIKSDKLRDSVVEKKGIEVVSSSASAVGSSGAVGSIGSKIIKDKTMVCANESSISSATTTANRRERLKNNAAASSVVDLAGENSEMCHWTKCFQVLPTGSDMIEHMRSAHVDAQVNAESFVCLWEGCKVYNRASCSLSWLERHVLTHSGTKPFKCIVEGCGQRFTSQNALERHVNSHFNQQQSHNGNSNGKRNHDTTPSKIVKKKRLRYKKSLWTARNDDFFDSGIMEMVRHQLMMTSNETRLDLDGSSNSVTFQSTVIARHVEPSGQVRMLLHWVPENM